MSQTPDLFLSVGKQVKDQYGRTIGKIASFAVTPSGRIDAAFIEQGDGRFLKQTAERLKTDGGDIILVSRIKVEAGVLCDQIPLIWRKDQALRDLTDKKKISKECYTDLHTSFEGALTQLRSEAQALSIEVDKEIARCSEESTSLNYALVHLEIEHEIGRIDNKYYETAFQMIQDNIKRVITEKNDLELTKSKLANIMLGDSAKSLEGKAKATDGQKTPAPASVLPEPPVVVYVKEIGRTGA